MFRHYLFKLDDLVFSNRTVPYLASVCISGPCLFPSGVKQHQALGIYSCVSSAARKDAAPRHAGELLPQRQLGRGSPHPAAELGAADSAHAESNGAARPPLDPTAPSSACGRGDTSEGDGAAPNPPGPDGGAASSGLSRRGKPGGSTARRGRAGAPVNASSAAALLPGGPARGGGGSAGQNGRPQAPHHRHRNDPDGRQRRRRGAHARTARSAAPAQSEAAAVAAPKLQRAGAWLPARGPRHVTGDVAARPGAMPGRKVPARGRERGEGAKGPRRAAEDRTGAERTPAGRETAAVAFPQGRDTPRTLRGRPPAAPGGPAARDSGCCWRRPVQELPPQAPARQQERRPAGSWGRAVPAAGGAP